MLPTQVGRIDCGPGLILVLALPACILPKEGIPAVRAYVAGLGLAMARRANGRRAQPWRMQQHGGSRSLAATGKRASVQICASDQGWPLRERHLETPKKISLELEPPPLHFFGPPACPRAPQHRHQREPCARPPPHAAAPSRSAFGWAVTQNRRGAVGGFADGALTHPHCPHLK